MYRIAIENMLGLVRQGNELHVAPCVNPSWTSFEVTYRYGQSELLIAFENLSGVPSGVRNVELDGQSLPGTSIPLRDDGRRHRARVVLAEAPSAQVGERVVGWPSSTADAGAR
jgi:cellobiose phosphorylase